MQIQNAKYNLVTTWCGGMVSRTLCHSGNGDKCHVIDSDEPVALGGEGRAPGPQDLMLAAFNACMTAAFVQEVTGAGLRLTHLDIETRGELLTGISRLCEKTTDISPGRLQYVIHVSGEGTVHQFECVHQRVIDASLNRWLLAQHMTIEGDLILI